MMQTNYAILLTQQTKLIKPFAVQIQMTNRII